MPVSSYADVSHDYDLDLDLESRRLAAVEKSPDLVARLVHVSREGKLPLIFTTTTSVRPDSTPTQHQQLLNQQHHYVVPRVDQHQQYRLQVSQIATSPSKKTSIASPRYSSLDSPDNARLTEPFSSDYLLHGFESEGRRPTSIDQFRPSPPTATSPPQSTPTSPSLLDVPRLSLKQINVDNVGTVSSKQDSSMFFGELQRNSAAAHRRRSMATTSALTDYEADLTSKDRMKQKDAIKRILAEKLREDWSWSWPRKDDGPGTPIVNRSQESLLEDDWKEREEWISNASGSEDESGDIIDKSTVVGASNNNDPFRFDSPDGVGDILRKTAEDRKARRRRRLEEEMRKNDGLNCFTHRRNAWTCARHIRRIPRASSATTPLKRTLSRTNSRPSPAAPSLSISAQEEASLDLITEIPIAPPILPPETPMRKGINERAYATIYDKVILQSQTPFCPINLSVITKSCVVGWKRDGEWPSKAGEVEAVIASAKKNSVRYEGNGGRAESRESEGKDGVGSKNKGVLRRSLQKVIGAMKERTGSKGKEGELVPQEGE